MTEKASASPISGAGDSKGSLDPSEQITFTDDPVLPEVSEAAKKELQVRQPPSPRKANTWKSPGSLLPWVVDMPRR